MAKAFSIHPKNPQLNRIQEIAQYVRLGGVLLYPTDSNYALGCDIYSKNSIEKIKFIRQLPDHYPLSILVANVSLLSQYAKVSDPIFKLIKKLSPGPYTYILPATRNVPKLLINPKRKTIGIRIPSNPIALELLTELNEPLVSITAKLDEEILDYPSIYALFDKYGPFIDYIIDDEDADLGQESTIIDCITDIPVVIRSGRGAKEAEDTIAYLF